MNLLGTLFIESRCVRYHLNFSFITVHEEFSHIKASCEISTASCTACVWRVCWIPSVNIVILLMLALDLVTVFLCA